MSYKSLSLNGTWSMFYTEEKYFSKEVPDNFKHVNADYPDINYFTVPDAVPGYWEDMTDKFSYTPFYGDLKVTPDFGFMKSPMVMCGPDTVLPNIYGTFYYKRTFEFDGSKGDKTIHFEGVQNTAKVWINGKFLGEHIGYSTPFEFVIPEDTLVKGENTIHMVVSNYKLLGYEENPIVGCTSRATTESTGGVTGDVEIRVYASPLRDVAFVVSKDCKTVFADIEATDDFKAEWKIYDKGTVIKEGVCEGSFEFDTAGMKLWSPEEPYLYTMEIATKSDKISRKFGVRRLVADGVHYKLNGYPYYLRGICEHGYFAETMHPDHDSIYYRKEIKALKKLGFNYVRMHTFVPEEEFFDAADELGILMHVESPNNTTLEEWREIVKFARRHTSVVIYCSGNELLLDDPFIEHLHKCADVVHAETDSLYSPMSALRGVEYWFFEGFDPGIEKDLVEKPFKHNPRRLAELNKFCDMYNSYSLGHLSYRSTDCDSEFVDSIGEVYGKPRSTHEMGIIGAYLDLRLKPRYEKSRLAYARIHQSVEDHMREQGVFDKFPVYFRNSVELQRRIRKQCMERCRIIESMAGYDLLGAIDHMNHNNSYCGGIMNEFYEIKETDSLREIRMYNSESVLLCDINKDVNFTAGDILKTAILTSFYARENLKDGILNITLTLDGKVIDRKRINLEEIETGKISKLYDYEFKLPMVEKPGAMKLYTNLEGAQQFIENEWELYVFPQPETVEKNDLVIVNDITEEELISAMKKGKKVLLLGAGPFASLPTKFINSRPGRPHDDLATIIYDHPIFKDMPHDGFCGWQFNKMLDGGTAVCFINDSVPFEPVLEMASSYKYIIRRAAIFEYNIFKGKLLVCGLNFVENDPASMWLKAEIIKYATSDEFDPMITLTDREFEDLLHGRLVTTPIYNSFALNTNDKSSSRKKRK